MMLNCSENIPQESGEPEKARVGRGAEVFGTRAAAVLGLLLAGWPVLRWYALRLNDGSDEPAGLVALAAALLFAPWRGALEPLSSRRHAALAYVLIGYCMAFPLAPPLARALIFVVLLGVAAAPSGFAFAWWMLLALSLPVVATLQFYLGYPLRAVTAGICAPLLGLGGSPVFAEGVTLNWAGERVVIDAPCSGLHMLWTGLLIAALAACLLRLPTRAALTLFRQTALCVFVANVLRATVLFQLETGRWPNPSWAHETVGLALFGAAMGAVLFLAERRTRRTPAQIP